VAKSDPELSKNFSVTVNEKMAWMHTEWLVEPSEYDDNIRQAELWSRAVTKRLKEKGDGKLLVDISQVQTVSRTPPSRSKEIFLRTLQDGRIASIAIVVTDLILKSIFISYLHQSGKGDHIKMFEKREDAEKWLGAEDN
jgi:hypothetical protein